MSRYQCDTCEYSYDESTGHLREGFPPGTTWDDVPEDFVCPDCGVCDKGHFVSLVEQRPPTH